MENTGQNGLVNKKWSMRSHAGYESASNTADIRVPPITSCKINE